MQVTDVQDHVTHAVIGANAARSFGISDSPEFFNILSNTLYSNKPLAVGRETLCNAWDAHIASGRTDKAVEITLNGEVLIIRDYGTGIQKDLMHPIYCIYGASTKTNNGEETGGFGLGCKAPFAYTDHFEVTSWCEGLKTIYRISKSSGEIGGKPGLMEIASFPTEETGLQVRIEMKAPRDAILFEDVIRQIALAGEMNVELNGEKLPTLPFSKAKDGYILTREPVAATGQGSIYVRYGSVIYPVTSSTLYAEAYEEARNLVQNLPTSNTYWPWRLILQAKPNTITVTPSRESLEMGDKTLNTLRDLLTAFNALRRQRQTDETMKIAAEGIAGAFMSMKPTQVLNPTPTILGTSRRIIEATTSTHDFKQVSRLLAAKEYPADANFRRRDVTHRLKALIASGFGNRGKIQTFLRAFRKLKYQDLYDYRYINGWFLKEIIAPLILDLRANKLMAEERLLVYGKSSAASVRRSRQWPYTEDMFHRPLKFEKGYLTDYMPFLRNVIFLAFNRDDVEERAKNIPAMRFWFGDPKDSLVYMVQRSDPRIAEARKFFAERGFFVIDLTMRHKHEPEEVTAPRVVREYKPRKKGIPVLSSVFDKERNLVRTDRAEADDVSRVEKPAFVATCTGKDGGYTIDVFSMEASTAVVRLFGSQGGVVVNKAQKLKYMDAGAADALPWVMERVLAELKTNERIRQYMAKNHNRVPDAEGWVRLVCNDPVLQTYYDLTPNLTPQDRDYLAIWSFLKVQFRYSQPKEMAEVDKLLNSVPLDKTLVRISKATLENTLLNCCIYTSFYRRFTEKNTPEQEKAKMRDFLIFALRG